MAKKSKSATPEPRIVDDTIGWRKVTLGDVVIHKQEVERDPVAAGFERYLKVEHLDADCLKISRWGNLADDELPPTFYKVFRSGQVLYPTRNPHLRRTAYASFDGICGEKTLTLESNGEIEPRLLPFIFQTERFIDHAKSMAIGSTNPHVRWRDIAAYEFSLPPKDEQRRIAEILWAADESLEAFLGVVKNLRLLADAIAIAAFSVADREPDLAETMAALGEVADIRYGLTVDRSRAKLSKIHPYLRVANVQRGRIDLTEVKEIGSDDQDVCNCSLHAGDVLVVEGHADPSEIGRAALWQNELPLCLHQNHILRVRASGVLLPQYLLAFLNSPKGKAHFRRFAKSSSGLYTINSTVLRDVQIPVPDAAFQQDTVHTIELIQRQAAVIEQHLASFLRLKMTVMGNLLKGS